MEEPNLNFNDESDNEFIIEEDIDDEINDTENEDSAEDNEDNDNEDNEDNEDKEDKEDKDTESLDVDINNDEMEEDDNKSDVEFNYNDEQESDDESDDTSDSSESDDEMYLFDEDIEENMIESSHNLLKINNMTEVKVLCKVVRDDNNNVIDEHHRTLPILTKYERAKILGIRANQINSGCKAFVETTENDIDGYLIAEKELLQKKIPFIIKRPLPSGFNEYWNVNDLELVN